MYEIDENGELVFKRKVVMTMTEERAALLDKILLAATESNQTVILHATSPMIKLNIYLLDVIWKNLN